MNKELNSDLRYYLLKYYGHDPLYKNVILASNQDSYDRAKNTLISIRGNQAMENIKSMTRYFFKNNN